MVFVSITRLRLRSFLYLLPFLYHTDRSTRQLLKANGFLKGKTLLDRRLTFWTMSLWVDDRAMKAYRNTDAHKKAMPRLQHWCNEASITHWQQEGDEFPDWQTAHLRMMQEGRLSKVKHPALTHSLQQIAPPRYPSKTERILLPRKSRAS